MFTFSPSEQEFVRSGLINNFRVDGRTLSQRRALQIKCNILDNLAGSSYVCIDHGKTQIYTGIKLKVESCAEGDSPKNKVILQISSMRRLTGELANCLSYLQELLQEHFINKQTKGFDRLQIPNSKRHFLQMHIQTFILSDPHLSLFESLLLSIRKALASTSIPKLESFINEVTNQETIELTNECVSLNLSAVDSLLLIGGIDGKYILDLSPLQFQSVDFVILVSVKEERVQGIESIKGSITAEQIHKIARFAINNSK